MSGEGLQARFESNPLGQALISGFLVFVLAGTVAWNLPESELKRVTVPIVQPVTLSLGLDQAWGVFAPEPRKQTNDLEARITYASGVTDTWEIPKRTEPFLSPFRVYHWQKVQEFMWGDDSSGERVRPFAIWIARRHHGAGRVPVEVTLVRQWYDLPPPGSGQSRAPWREYAYFTLQVTPDMLKEGLR